MTKNIQAHFYFTKAVDLVDAKNLFHRWIQTDRLDGLFLDVVDYRHVQDGPGILLVGHEGDVGIRQVGSRSQLTYRQKRDWPTELLQEQIWWLIQRAQEIATVIESDTGAAIDTQHLELEFVDRLHFPNRPEVAEQIQAALAMFIGEEVVWTSEFDPHRLLQFEIKLALQPT